MTGTVPRSFIVPTTAGPRRGWAQAVLLGEQEVPQPQRGRRVVQPQLQQAEVAAVDVPTERAAVIRLASPPRAALRSGGPTGPR